MTVKTPLALMLTLLLTCCRNEDSNVEAKQICKVVTFSAANVDDRAAKLTIDGKERGSVFSYVLRPQSDEETGHVTQKICGKVPVRFRSGTLDVAATVDASTDVNVVYIDPNANPVIWSTNDAYPIYD